MGQLDLFATPPRAFASATVEPARKTLQDLLPRRPFQWERRVAAAPADLPLELMVASDWAGEVLEVLSLPSGRLFLFRDGEIRDVIPDVRFYRLAMLLPTQARAIAAKVPLGLLGSPGANGCRLAAAETAWPELSDWLDGIEAAAAREKPWKMEV